MGFITYIYNYLQHFLIHATYIKNYKNMKLKVKLQVLKDISFLI